MFLPIRTSVRPLRTPYTNYGLIIANLVIFLLSYSPYIDSFGHKEVLRRWAEQFMLTPGSPDIWQFVTYAFLHGGKMHIFGNMFFLYMFGNAVNDKLGNIGYLCLFLAGAVFSGLGHAMLSPSPVLGASGAVAAVTGAYLVLFPQSIITVVYWFFFIGTFEIQAYFFIIIKMIVIDNLLYTATPNVAYDAHLSGYAFGILAMILLLSTRLLQSDHLDLWAMMRQWNRRRVFRDTVNSQPNGVYTKSVRSKVVKSPEQLENEQKIDELRVQVTRLISQHNLPDAARCYLQITQIDKHNVLSRQQQLDISNQLMAMSLWEPAAAAYELFLTHYGNCQYSEQVELMLGVIYARYLSNPEKAVKYLKSAREKIHDSGQRKMCDEELDKLAKMGHE